MGYTHQSSLRTGVTDKEREAVDRRFMRSGSRWDKMQTFADFHQNAYSLSVVCLQMSVEGITGTYKIFLFPHSFDVNGEQLLCVWLGVGIQESQWFVGSGYTSSVVS